MRIKHSIYLLISILLIMVGCGQSHTEAHEELRIENRKLTDDLDKSYLQIDSLTKKLGNIEAQIQDSIYVLIDSIYSLQKECDILINTNKVVQPSDWLGKYEIEELKEMGFKNPQKEILGDLYNNKTLFIEDGILGGTMRIHSAMMIGTKYVLAEGEDGHIGIYYLLEYSVNKNKKITWKTLYKADVFG